MPELPEVETVRRVLSDWIKDKEIIDINIYYDKVLENIDFKSFKDSLINKRVNEVNRYGKYLFIVLDNYTLISHLRMEGKYFFVKSKEEINEYINKHKIISFTFKDGILIYHDVRKFGKMKLIKGNNYMLDSSIAKLGKEPFDYEYLDLYNNIHKLNTSIKKCLLDQSVICGLGNIYVDEILFDAKILPTRKANLVSKSDCKNIIESSKKILSLAITNNGSTIATYHFANNESGNFQNFHKVYGKKGCKCSKCDNIIEKIVVAGRGTYYCKVCQK